MIGAGGAGLLLGFTPISTGLGTFNLRLMHQVNRPSVSHLKADSFSPEITSMRGVSFAKFRRVNRLEGGGAVFVSKDNSRERK